jgi:galactokinase
MTRLYVSPGRIEFVGKHVDYAGGRSITCATSMAIRVRASMIDERGIRVNVAGARPYTEAVARRLLRDFPRAKRGVALEITSDLPESAGLSSSSALVVAAAQALVDANELHRDERWRENVRDDLARAAYFAAMETGEAFGPFPGDPGVGVRGGAQDPVAIMCAEEGHVRQFSYLPPAFERSIPWPEDHTIVIADSGVRATKTANAQQSYNNLSDAMRGFDRRPGAIAGSRNIPPELRDRIAQFREETDVIVPGFGDALRDRDFARLGTLVDRSQHLAESVLGNQIPETVFLARDARYLGAAAASAFGAGFGGAVWAMVADSDRHEFVERWAEAYRTRFPERRGRFMTTKPAKPAHVES